MIDTIRQNDDEAKRRPELDDAGGSGGGFPTPSISRALMGYAVILGVPIGAIYFLIDYTLNNNVIIHSDSIDDYIIITRYIVSYIPFAFLPTLGLSPMIFRLLGRRDIAGALARWHYSWCTLVVVLLILQILVYIFLISDVSIRIDYSLFDGITALLLLLSLVKVMQAFAAWVPWTQRLLTSKPSGALSTQTDERPAQSDPLAALSNERRWLVRELMQRAARLRDRAAMVLLAIIALILGGIISIYLAGDLVSSDAQQTTRLTQLTSIINNYKSEIEESQGNLSRTEVSLAARVVDLRSLRFRLYDSGIRTPDIEAALKNAGAELVQFSPRVLAQEGSNERADETDSAIGAFENQENLRDENDEVIKPTNADDAAQTDLPPVERLLERRKELLQGFAQDVQTRETLNEEIKAARNALSQLERELTENVQDYLVNTEPKETDVALLVASAATRFGILIVVIFLVQILVGIYRYSQRLSAFYAARADALTASLDRKSGLGDWGTEMLPEMIDFGRNPAPPAQYVVDAMRAYFDRRSRRQGGAAEDKPST